MLLSSSTVITMTFELFINRLPASTPRRVSFWYIPKTSPKHGKLFWGRVQVGCSTLLGACSSKFWEGRQSELTEAERIKPY